MDVFISNFNFVIYFSKLHTIQKVCDQKNIYIYIPYWALHMNKKNGQKRPASLNNAQFWEIHT